MSNNARNAQSVTFGLSNNNLYMKNGAGSEHGVSSMKSLPRRARRPAALRMIRQVVCKGVTLGRRGISVVSTNTKNTSPGDTPARTQRIGVPHTDVRNSQRCTMLDTMVPNLFCILCPRV